MNPAAIARIPAEVPDLGTPAAPVVQTLEPTPREACTLADLIGLQQLACMRSLARGQEGDFYRNAMRHALDTAATMPTSYQTDGQGGQAVARLHYFRGGADWYITERDTSAQQHQAFGLADLGYGPELGYISIAELIAAGVELDLHWTPATLDAIRADKGGAA